MLSKKNVGFGSQPIFLRLSTCFTASIIFCHFWLVGFPLLWVKSWYFQWKSPSTLLKNPYFHWSHWRYWTDITIFYGWLRHLAQYYLLWQVWWTAVRLSIHPVWQYLDGGDNRMGPPSDSEPSWDVAVTEFYDFWGKSPHSIQVYLHPSHIQTGIFRVWICISYIIDTPRERKELSWRSHAKPPSS